MTLCFSDTNLSRAGFILSQLNLPQSPGKVVWKGAGSRDVLLLHKNTNTNCFDASWHAKEKT